MSLEHNNHRISQIRSLIEALLKSEKKKHIQFPILKGIIRNAVLYVSESGLEYLEEDYNLLKPSEIVWKLIERVINDDMNLLPKDIESLVESYESFCTEFKLSSEIPKETILLRQVIQALEKEQGWLSQPSKYAKKLVNSSLVEYDKDQERIRLSPFIADRLSEKIRKWDALK